MSNAATTREDHRSHRFGRFELQPGRATPAGGRPAGRARRARVRPAGGAGRARRPAGREERAADAGLARPGGGGEQPAGADLHAAQGAGAERARHHSGARLSVRACRSRARPRLRRQAARRRRRGSPLPAAAADTDARAHESARRSCCRCTAARRIWRRSRRCCASTSCVTIVGAGGIGKTRVAQAVAAEIAVESAADFPDGVWWVELAALSDGALVPSAVARALGVQLPGDRRPPPPSRRCSRRSDCCWCSTTAST